MHPPKRRWTQLILSIPTPQMLLQAGSLERIKPIQHTTATDSAFTSTVTIITSSFHYWFSLFSLFFPLTIFTFSFNYHCIAQKYLTSHHFPSPINSTQTTVIPAHPPQAGASTYILVQALLSLSQLFKCFFPPSL